MAGHIRQRVAQDIRGLHGARPALIAFNPCIAFKPDQRDARGKRRKLRLLLYRLKDTLCIAGLGAVVTPLPDHFGYGPP